MELRRICGQIRVRVGVTGKFVLTKELGWTVAGRTGAGNMQ